MTDGNGTADAKRALVTEATKKAAVLWLSIGGQPAYAVWCLPMRESLYVVTGSGEQPAPGLREAATVRVSVRGDHGGRIVSWDATVCLVEPGSETWAEVALQLAGKRLNAPGPAEDVVTRWSRECTVVRLDPTGDGIEAAAAGSADSQAAPPRPSPAARRTAKPYRLHRVKRRR